MNKPEQPRLFYFIRGAGGTWRVDQLICVFAESIVMPTHVAVFADLQVTTNECTSWKLCNIVSSERYVTYEEKAQLAGQRESLARGGSILAAMVAIKKSAAWWVLSQCERREIFESQSRRIGIGMQYLAAIARRLHHCHDLGPDEASDFITWFEYALTNAPAAERLLEALRATADGSMLCEK